MAKFLDYHKVAPQLPPEGVEMVKGAIKSGSADEFGVKPLNAFMGGGQMWCLTEAPSADAVCKSHESHGIPLGVGEVTEIQSFV